MKPKQSLRERILDAEGRAGRWLADGNQAQEGGNQARAEECFAKSQYWLDRANLLSGQGEKAPPRS